MKSLFISRSLDKDSPIRAFCEENGLSFHDTSLLKLEAVEFSFEASFDWLFFYSKNGINYFFEGLEEEFDPFIKIACFGEATASHLENTTRFKADFIGKGVAIQIAKNFEKILNRNDRVCFVQARNSQQSVQKALAIDNALEQLVVYDNVVDASIDIPMTSIVILTSPLNAQAYFAQHQIHANQKLIAIGSTTARAIKEFTGHHIFKPMMPNEKMLVALLTSLGIA